MRKHTRAFLALSTGVVLSGSSFNVPVLALGPDYTPVPHLAEPPDPNIYPVETLVSELPPAEPIRPQPALEPRIYQIRMRVTACSPHDPRDKAYYAEHGYEGAVYGIAADLREFPRGTEMRIAGYRRGAWMPVDSAGGSIIRRSTARGVPHIDVKFATLWSATKWGSRWMTVDVRLPDHASRKVIELAKRRSKREIDS